MGWRGEWYQSCRRFGGEEELEYGLCAFRFGVGVGIYGIESWVYDIFVNSGASVGVQA
jgi:hypothetical protein